MPTSLTIAMIGTRGVPARYGGFETAVEEIGQRLARRGHDVVVYCRNKGQTDVEFEGMRLVNLAALRIKQLETLTHTSLSIAHVRRHRPDVGIVFNAANAPLLPALRAMRVPTAVHVDGLEWKRAKWSALGRRYYKLAERLAVRWADEVIADAKAIQDYYADVHSTHSVFIPYGTVIRSDLPHERLAELGLTAGNYHLVVARMEPENNVHVIVEAFAGTDAKLPLVVVGAAHYGDDYAARVKAAARGRSDVHFLGSMWDQQLLDVLYANCASYLHGHSVGGTNPSLLRAMGAGAPTIAIDVVFNREVLGEAGLFFYDPDSLGRLLRDAERDPDSSQRRGELARERVRARYDWDDVADRYERLCRDLSAGSARARRERPRDTNRHERAQRNHEVGLLEPDAENSEDHGEGR
jgi:glycosyltransferase involved in cell wall biosynthesis